MGDPSGISPEIIAKAFEYFQNFRHIRLVFIGDFDHLQKYLDASLFFSEFSSTNEIDQFQYIHIPTNEPIIPSRPSLKNASAIIKSIEVGYDLCHKNDARALVTAPINKNLLSEAGFSFPGHTEFLESLSNRSGKNHKSVMVLKNNELLVALTTIHIPINQISSNLTEKLLTDTINILHHSLLIDFDVKNPKIAVCGLNPHAGENGKIGREEIDIINPVIHTLKLASMNIEGSFSADSLFHKESRTRFDAFVCQYHDQGLIAVKTIDFYNSVNITIGLPIVRTSPDHGTAYEIAGQNKANAQSIIQAINEAHHISINRNKWIKNLNQ